ncbi:PAS domain S-box protein [Hymenobacter sediminis]|uniref:PAS domain-containing protein n=1 Tax=Hymenobacter sediminis TaxID=2218621 RepID=UPI000DA68981|nr:PAS domain-containing protein [Hymenobacter sediminis]RPD44154.1 PAS domain S-box protein [Hymenobacter sediminis]
MASGAPVVSATPFQPEGLLLDLLAVSLTGLKVLRPVYDPAGELVDFTIEYLNPVGQRLLGLAERPGGPLLTHFPHAIAAGILDYYRRVYEAEATDEYEVNYQADGLDNYFRLAARRSSEWLVVSFADTSNQNRSAVEVALRATQADEQAARAKADHQRRELWGYVQQAPVAVVLYQGPQHRVTLANAAALTIWDRSWADVQYRPVFEVLPEAAAPPIVALFDHVFATGTPYTAHELPTTIVRHGRPEVVYWNFVFQAERQPDGRISGIISVGTEVTEQVRARQQVEQLNQELEARVRARTEQLSQQQALLQQILGQVPAAIGTLTGPEHRYTFFNDRYRAMATGRLQVGRSVAEAHPEVVVQGVVGILDKVYATGQVFIATEMAVQLHEDVSDQLEQRYLDYIYQPLTDERNQTTGILVFVLDVTEKVQTRERTIALQADLLAAAQRQVQERETFYRVFEETPAAICIQRGPEHRYEYVNPAYEAFFPGRKLLGRPVAEVLPETVGSGVLALLDRVYETGETYSGVELPLLMAQPEGPPQQLYFTFTYQALRENGEIVGITTFAYNVAEQVRTRQQQLLQQRELEQLFMQAPTPIVILDGPSLVFQLVNPAYQRIFPGRELAGKPLLEALPELVGTPIPDLFQRVYQTGESVTVHELPLLMARHEGQTPEEIYWTFTYQARRTPDGRIDGVSVFAHDVTEQVRTRQATAASTHRLRLITDALPVLIGYLDRERRYQFANEAYRTWFHQDPAALLGRPVREVVGEHAYAAVASYMDRALAGEQLHFEATMPYREGFTKHIRTSYIPDVQQGIVQGFYTLVTDVTEQVQARQQVEQLNQTLTVTNAELSHSNTQLTRTNVDLDNFIYTASHDLKAPISNIEGLLLALEHELPAAGRVGHVPVMLGMMQDATERFKRTILHLTEVARLQHEHSPTSEQVPLAAVIEAVRLDLVPLLQQTQAQLEVQVPPALLLTSSEKTLRSVVYNLLSNALKYRHPDRVPYVRLRYYPQGDYQVLEVQDNGLGLDLSQGQDKLFAMFQRLHTHVEGTGIGLYMVKKMVENAGGYIEVESQVGQGSVFRVYFRL